MIVWELEWYGYDGYERAFHPLKSDAEFCAEELRANDTVTQTRIYRVTVGGGTKKYLLVCAANDGVWWSNRTLVKEWKRAR